MHGDALLLQLLSELTGLPLHFQKYLSIVFCRSCCTFATFELYLHLQTVSPESSFYPALKPQELKYKFVLLKYYCPLLGDMVLDLLILGSNLVWMFLYSLHQVFMSLVDPLGIGDRESRTRSLGSFYI